KKHLEPSVTDKEYFVAANEAMMREVWINLIDNAVKFSVEYAPLDIEIESEAETLTIEISNRGEPIPENAVPKIWDKFYQGDESHATKGNGIGLAVVKKVVELHNGEVSAICSGGVTTFTVKLPK
ncbi:MAG: sensor histidine kinase, partial [Lachnospiraceae bacterium]|nr:sensor histidine kinase [Lachnospiraceae bacterium]